MISASPISASPVSSSPGGPVFYSIIASATLSATPTSTQDVLERTERHVLVFAAEIEPWVLTR